MRKIFLGGLLIAFCTTSIFAASKKKRVAILDFDFGTVQRWWSGNWDIGKGISDLLVTELVTDGTYRVIERKALDAVLAEQNFSNSERANSTSASRIGKVLGVNAMVVGSITQFGTEKKKFGLGGFGGGIGGFGGGKVGTQEGKAVVAIDARVVDVNTGEILAVARGKGESSRSGLMLGGAGGGGGGFGGAGIEMGSSDFRESIIGEATTAAVQAVAQKLTAADQKLPEITVEIRGLVADVAGSTIILNVGSSHGVEVGETLNILRRNPNH
jgi:curli biogenesis system outer membrane secretion channel CsgG